MSKIQNLKLAKLFLPHVVLHTWSSTRGPPHVVLHTWSSTRDLKTHPDAFLIALLGSVEHLLDLETVEETGSIFDPGFSCS
jgi:hypothetical protein